MDNLNIHLFNPFMPGEEFSNYTEEALENYIIHGLPPGGFLQAVLVGDLYLAVARADHWNAQSLGKIVEWIRNNAPKACYSDCQNYDVIDTWYDDVDNVRTKYVEKLSKEQMWQKLND